MTFKETMAKLFDSSEGAYYKWKRENRPIITLLEKYFTKEELEEFLMSGKISRMESNVHTDIFNYSLYNVIAESFKDIMHPSYFLFFIIGHHYFQSSHETQTKFLSKKNFIGFVAENIDIFTEEYNSLISNFDNSNEQINEKDKGFIIAMTFDFLQKISEREFEYIVHNAMHLDHNPDTQFWK